MSALKSVDRITVMVITLVNVCDRLRAIVGALTSKIDRQFARFASVPYHDPQSRRQWEQLWETDSRQPAVQIIRQRPATPPNRAAVFGGIKPNRNRRSRGSRIGIKRRRSLGLSFSSPS
jgi:hypothetical protein